MRVGVGKGRCVLPGTGGTLRCWVNGTHGAWDNVRSCTVGCFFISGRERRSKASGKACKGLGNNGNGDDDYHDGYEDLGHGRL